MTRKDSFTDGDGAPRPASTYEFNYGAGAVGGGFVERTNTDDADFDPSRDHAYSSWREAFEKWRSDRQVGNKQEFDKDDR